MIQFADRMSMLKGSEIREFMALTAKSDFISFAGGMPAPELFPTEQIMEAARIVLEEKGQEALQYGTTEGIPRLREQIAERMKAKNNIDAKIENILITKNKRTYILIFAHEYATTSFILTK